MPLTFTALKTAVPRPDVAYGLPLESVGRRGKYLLLQFEPVTFVVHLMQGGRLLVDEKQSAKPRNGQARFVFDDGPGAAADRAGHRTPRRGVVRRHSDAARRPAARPARARRRSTSRPSRWPRSFATTNMRIHGYLRDQHMIAGLGRDAGERDLPSRQDLAVRHDRQARSPTGRRRWSRPSTRRSTRASRTSAPDRHELVEGPSGRVHGRVGEPCPVCGDTIRSVAYSGYTVAYCPTCQTGGKVLADNTTSRFLK